MIGIVGAPGAGKNTQAELLANFLNCPYFSHGELIRKYVTSQARQEMLEGKIIDDSITLGLVDKALAGVDVKNKECIIEGGPRTLDQAKWWEAKVASGVFKVTGIIHLIISEDLANQRMIKRGRLDDQKKVMEKRFLEYRANTKKGLRYLKDKSLQIHEIDASGSIQEVHNLVLQALGLNKLTKVTR
jgi:adenylate kinase